MTHKPKPSPSQTLLQSTLQPTGEPGQFDVVIVKAQQTALVPLTDWERMAVERAHGSQDLHKTRPTIVKTMLLNGYTVKEINALFKHLKGFGIAQINKDKAALLEAGLKIP